MRNRKPRLRNRRGILLLEEFMRWLRKELQPRCIAYQVPKTPRLANIRTVQVNPFVQLDYADDECAKEIMFRVLLLEKVYNVLITALVLETVKNDLLTTRKACSIVPYNLKCV